MSVGTNKWRNHPKIIESSKVKESCSVHAEIDAISRVSNPKGATIYVARVSKNGNPVFSRPCKYCYKVIRDAGISKIIYT